MFDKVIEVIEAQTEFPGSSFKDWQEMKKAANDAIQMRASFDDVVQTAMADKLDVLIYSEIARLKGSDDFYRDNKIGALLDLREKAFNGKV